MLAGAWPSFWALVRALSWVGRENIEFFSKKPAGFRKIERNCEMLPLAAKNANFAANKAVDLVDFCMVGIYYLIWTIPTLAVQFEFSTEY